MQFQNIVSNSVTMHQSPSLLPHFQEKVGLLHTRFYYVKQSTAFFSLQFQILSQCTIYHPCFQFLFCSFKSDQARTTTSEVGPTISSTVGIFKPPLFLSSVIVVLETSGRLPLQRRSITIAVISTRYVFGISR